jgi:hypothetical protein
MVAGFSPAALRSSNRFSWLSSQSSGAFLGWRSLRLVRPIAMCRSADVSAAIFGATTLQTPIALTAPPAAIAFCSSPMRVAPNSAAAARAASIRCFVSSSAPAGLTDASSSVAIADIIAIRGMARPSRDGCTTIMRPSTARFAGAKRKLRIRKLCVWH